MPRDSFSTQSAKAILEKSIKRNSSAPASENKSEETSQYASSITPKVSDRILSEETEIKSDNISQRDSIQSQDSGVTEDVITKEKGDQTNKLQQLQEKSDETIPEVLLLPAQLEQCQQSPKQSVKSLEQSQPSLHQSEQSLAREQKPPTPPVKEKKASIVFKDNIVLDMDDEKRHHAKRPSAVSWRALNTPSDSDSTASLEQVVKDATAKAESFRQNLDTKRQHSLLDIVKKRSTLEKAIEDEPKPPPPPPPKRKKFFNFKCRDKKKEREKEKEKEKEEHQSES